MSQIATSAAEEIMAEYASAIRDKDPSRLAALYAPDVRVFDAWGIWSYEDWAAWDRNLGDWLGSLGNEGVSVRFDDVRRVRRSDVEFVSAFVTYSAIDATGSVLRSMQNRLSWMLVIDEGKWVIAHEHTSAPISFENLQAILSRE